MQRFFIIAIVICNFVLPCEAALLIFGEYGSYNKSYKDRQYKETPKTTFSVPMSTLGAEYRVKARGQSSIGGTFVFSSISSGSVDNFGEKVAQPEVLYAIPGIFAGYDFGFWAWDLGISCMFAGVKSEDRFYYTENGSEKCVQTQGLYWDRQLSHVYINGMLRILPEDFIHFKIRMGRERYNPVDTMVNIGVIFPYKNNEGELIFSGGTLEQQFFHSRHIMKSNQKIALRYGCRMDGFIFGITAGVIVHNDHGGHGYISVPGRLSAGADVTMPL